MMIEYDIPDLSQLTRGFPLYWTKVMFLGDRPADYGGHVQLHSMVRLTETAIRRYEDVRQLVPRFWKSPAIPVALVNEACCHLESCVVSMHRAATTAAAIRRNPAFPAELKEHFDWRQRAFVRNAKRIRNMRDSIQHTLEMTAKGEIAAGEPFMLQVDGRERTEGDQVIKTMDRARIGQFTISFSELAGWLREMAECAKAIAEFSPRGIPLSGPVTALVHNAMSQE
jgi:hypothetical protein